MFSRLAGNVPAGLPRQVSIVGAKSLVGKSNLGGTTKMIAQVLEESLDEAQLTMKDLDGLIAVPSLKEDHFMEAHYQATCLGLFSDQKRDRPALRCRTIDTGGAGPVTAMLEAVRMIKYEALECVAVVAADCVGSMNSQDFLVKADDIFFKLAQNEHWSSNNNDDDGKEKVKSPAIPHGYDRITQYQMENFGVTRDQLRMAVCLESLHAGLHPESLFRKRKLEEQRNNNNNKSDNSLLFTSLEEVRQAPIVTPNISLLECARRADGAACLVLASNRFLARRQLYREGLPTIIGSGESSGPLYPPHQNNKNGGITEAIFSCEEAMGYAYASAGNLTSDDIDFFGLYDCFPICLIRALEASGLCNKGKGGDYLESEYSRMMNAVQSSRSESLESLLKDKSYFPVNTHGGLLCYGAPWEVPAMFNIIEAANQIRGMAKGRQIKDCRRALVYGNGGILSASAVAILARSL